MPRDPVSLADTALLSWRPIPTDVDDNVPGPLWKILTSDPVTGAITFLTHLPPGWRDDVLDWHPSTEEGFILSAPSVPGRLGPGGYLYRQPGFLHGPAFAPPHDSVTILQRTDRPLRILRYRGTKYAHRAGVAVTDEHRDWPVEQVRVDTKELPWADAPAGGGWAGARYKWLHRNGSNGGGAVLLELPPNWDGRGASGRQAVEEFVVEGTLVAGGERYGKWGYACRAPGAPAGAYSAPSSATLLCWWDEGSELE
jgi:hypothetical protein